MNATLLRQGYEEVSPRFYWDNKKGKLWTNGYFCETVGDVSEDKILDYVENQGNDLN